MTDLTPLVLRDTPTLIETVFPAQKVSFEAQSERKSGRAQTLTGLGSFWKGRKPLILIRGIVLGSLLPQTGDSEKDIEIFEKLMAFDDHGLARRAFVQNAIKPKHIAAGIALSNPWDFFTFTGREGLSADDRFLNLEYPFDADQEGISLRWDQNASDEAKIQLIERMLGTFSTYEEKASFCKRPEEVDQVWLYAPIWSAVNNHYAQWGIKVSSFPDLVEQFGILRYGHRVKVGDSFCGGGSIPFEAARIGCDVYASDLNPIACMLTWGAFNVIGANSKERSEIGRRQSVVAEAVDQEITHLDIEHDEDGNRAKAYLYCLETRCPESGWSVPMVPSRVISRFRGVIAILSPNHAEKRFDIQIKSGASSDEIKDANIGTVQGDSLVYSIDGKKFRVPIRTIRGDYRDAAGEPKNRLRWWEKLEFKPRPDDIFQERLYCIHWITKASLKKRRWDTYFLAPSEADFTREQLVEKIVAENLGSWQAEGSTPDMLIELGVETERLNRTRGWTYWHHLFNPRQILMLQCILKHRKSEYTWLASLGILNLQSKLCAWHNDGRKGGLQNVFSNQALNALYNWGSRGLVDIIGYINLDTKNYPISRRPKIISEPVDQTTYSTDLWVTDPPYADAVHYHEITEFFIAWLRRHPPEEFRDWTWDSRRALAIKGSGNDFRRGMIDAYSAMAEHMPDNGMQCVMFTHQDTGIWSDMVGIFWAAGLQVVAAWYIATETTSELKKGGYVQGTVVLMLRKRPVGERPGFKQRILPAVRTEVKRQIESMMHLNDEVKDKLGEPVFNDSDLQMAGYAAALKVLTAYTHIGGEDVTSFALRPRQRGEETVVDEIVQQAAEAANILLVPKGLEAETWSRLTGVQRFYFRMMDMETTGASKLDNYQNFAKAFRVADYSKVMGNMAANSARLKRVTEFASRDLTDSTEFGPTWLGRLIIGLQQLLSETEPAVVVAQIQEDLPDFLEIRPLLIDMLSFIEQKAPEEEVWSTAEVLGGRFKNLRAFNQ